MLRKKKLNQKSSDTGVAVDNCNRVRWLIYINIKIDAQASITLHIVFHLRSML